MKKTGSHLSPLPDVGMEEAAHHKVYLTEYKQNQQQLLHPVEHLTEVTKTLLDFFSLFPTL